MSPAQLLSEIRKALADKPPAVPLGFPPPIPVNPFFVRMNPRCDRWGWETDADRSAPWVWHSTPTVSEFISFNGKVGLILSL